MLLIKAKRLVKFVFSHPLVLEMAEQGDKQSSHQTDHGMNHFLEVVKLARRLSVMLNEHKPGTLSDWDVEVVIPLAALLHDIGRAIDVDNHAAAGAKWARDFLRGLSLPDDSETLPRSVVNRICKIVACHRSSVVLRRDFDDACWAVVVLADKFAGDEERVRPGRAALLAMLTAFGLPFIPLRRGGVHDRVNFAIKKFEPRVEEGKLVLQLHLDARVLKEQLVLDTYSDRYVACHRAAAYLGLGFRIEFVLSRCYGVVAGLTQALSGRPCRAVAKQVGYDNEIRSWVLHDELPVELKFAA